ncbi:MAG: BMP family ABC transporter substrate-binding protein, partial [Alphaproteobacteria bacterium]|nr:BMP family ABC transporter substrate-binding protein [Alphaproteobacteria bacterium]
MRPTVSAAAVLLSVSVAAVVPSTGSAQSFKLEGKPNIAIILDTPHNDGGWSQTFDEARLRMEKDLGLKIAYVENVKEEATQFNPPVERFISRGANVIITTSFGYSDPVKAMAAKYPKVAFMNASWTSNGPN